MLTSPRRPSSTMRIFSSAECCRRVALRISRTVFSALSGMRLLACLIVAPQQGYDEPKILSYAISPFCPTSADGLHIGIMFVQALHCLFVKPRSAALVNFVVVLVEELHRGEVFGFRRRLGCGRRPF